MISTTLRHAAGCSTTKRPERTAGTGVVVFKCPGCGATASTSRSR